MTQSKFACYLIDVRNDGGTVSPEHELAFHRHVIKKTDHTIEELQYFGNQLLQQHPECDRMTIVGSGKKWNTVWLYDSSNKIITIHNCP